MISFTSARKLSNCLVKAEIYPPKTSVGSFKRDTKH